MRKDMAKVVTEGPRRGHGNSSNKWGRRLTRDEYSLDDHGASRAPIARRRQYGWDAKEFSDLLGPLRRYLRKQVGRPWDKVWSEITQSIVRRFDGRRFGTPRRSSGPLASRRRPPRTSDGSALTACVCGNAATAAGLFTPTATCLHRSYACSLAPTDARCPSTAWRTTST